MATLMQNLCLLRQVLLCQRREPRTTFDGLKQITSRNEVQRPKVFPFGLPGCSIIKDLNFFLTSSHPITIFSATTYPTRLVYRLYIMLCQIRNKSSSLAIPAIDGRKNHGVIPSPTCALAIIDELLILRGRLLYDKPINIDKSTHQDAETEGRKALYTDESLWCNIFPKAFFRFINETKAIRLYGLRMHVRSEEAESGQQEGELEGGRHQSKDRVMYVEPLILLGLLVIQIVQQRGEVILDLFADPQLAWELRSGSRGKLFPGSVS